MISYLLRTEGASTLLEPAELPVPEAATGQLLLRVFAAGLNRGEFIPGGLQGKAGVAKPAGIEAAGEVVALGAGVTDFQVGQRVMGRCPGAFSEFALMDARERMASPTRAWLARERVRAVLGTVGQPFRQRALPRAFR